MFYQDHSNGISIIDTDYIRPGLAAAFLLEENGHVCFIETGTSLAVPRLLAVLEAKNVSPEHVDYIIVTHVHLDHAGGAGQLLRHCPNARLLVHSRGARHLIEPTKLLAGVRAVYGEEQTRQLYGEIAAAPAERVLSPKDGESINFQGRNLLFIDTPGHARHHFCVWDARSRYIFTGDACGISYREFDSSPGAFIFPTTTPVQFEPQAMHESLDKLMAYQPRGFYLTHFGAVTGVSDLVAQLHQGIDDFTALTANLDGLAGEAREAALMTELESLLLARLQARRCSLSPAECAALLATDIKLNAQGLACWWDKK